MEVKVEELLGPLVKEEGRGGELWVKEEVKDIERGEMRCGRMVWALVWAGSMMNV